MKFIMVSYSVAMLIYILFPNCQELRPLAFERDNIFTRFLEGFYQFDTNTNVASGGKCSMDWVMENTAILHFCGTQKPWKPSHTSRFSALYKHYIFLAKRRVELLPH